MRNMQYSRNRTKVENKLMQSVTANTKHVEVMRISGESLQKQSLES